MLEKFWSNVLIGIDHVLDINAYDHILFLVVLAVPYLFKDWKRVLVLVSVFTLGHSLSLILAAYNIVQLNTDMVEFLIPVTIFIMAIFNLFTVGKLAHKTKIGLVLIATLFFGLIHGLGFAGAFKMLVGKTENKFITLMEFALGIEIAQIISVFIILFVGYIMQIVFRFSRRDWILVVSSIVIGLVIPMLIKSELLA
jgi:hypothetical protein